ncbi:hypothetical protein P280DRAFT_332343 [Massarina eburnea CBS 473.64]|uniref:Uncharacterized protein n=1 Tax=Massarina eburnea CBS 473.64 TaxID=1395130 RepID=A0A6A6S0L7_9PLEO|nr:hypothetical protein P280DRAFT_332343 [Massarina eburnea CBS 473.64]
MKRKNSKSKTTILNNPSILKHRVHGNGVYPVLCPSNIPVDINLLGVQAATSSSRIRPKSENIATSRIIPAPIFPHFERAMIFRETVKRERESLCVCVYAYPSYTPRTNPPIQRTKAAFLPNPKAPHNPLYPSLPLSAPSRRSNLISRPFPSPHHASKTLLSNRTNIYFHPPPFPTYHSRPPLFEPTYLSLHLYFHTCVVVLWFSQLNYTSFLPSPPLFLTHSLSSPHITDEPFHFNPPTNPQHRLKQFPNSNALLPIPFVCHHFNTATPQTPYIHKEDIKKGKKEEVQKKKKRHLNTYPLPSTLYPHP